MKYLTLTLFLVLGFFALGFQAEAQPVASALSDSGSGPGAGRTVTESINGGSGREARYEGLHEGATTSGDRWIKSGEGWQKDGKWEMDGDDIKVTDDSGNTVWTNKGMAKASVTKGSIKGSGLGGSSGTWSD